ncbi:MAG: carbamoyltransferase, partial [Bacteroidia bacterium]|nr:carbamoyltransferase [Bacteroidia bacterium]
MNILGFNCYGHDSAATLLIDNKIVFAVEEERLNRKKH